ncbi:nucleoside phosphorylase [Candidatus Avelusimicrobium luingense]|uniref:nucleoside phosphorylase n=1 Tax=Candidatus Avelusimicrobium luingense TaxID=3416211 RepID=UPI003D13680F
MGLIFPPVRKSRSAAYVTPKSYVDTVARGLKLPSKAVVCPLTPLVQALVKQENWKKRFLAADVYVSPENDFCYITGFGCGGPSVVLAVEQAIALGVQEIYFVGLAGSLQEEVLPGDMVVCEESICADGTSPHYTHKEIVRADKKLTARLIGQLRGKNMNFHVGRNWSTDAIFRETKAEIKHYQKNHVLTVDMETSALLAMCARRKIPCAAVYVISDCLGGQTWQPNFKNPQVWHQLRKLLNTIKSRS